MTGVCETDLEKAAKTCLVLYVHAEQLWVRPDGGGAGLL